jgi:hypothetical protein
MSCSCLSAPQLVVVVCGLVYSVVNFHVLFLQHPQKSAVPRFIKDDCQQCRRCTAATCIALEVAAGTHVNSDQNTKLNVPVNT